MTPSQWLDIAVLAVAFIAAISGWRSGALGSMLSFAGVLLGAIAGVLLAPHIVSHIAAPRAKLFAALFLILGLVVIGEVAGVVLGRAVRGAIRNRPIRVIDSVIGVAVQLVVVLTAAWLLATPLTQSKDQPELAAAVRGSRVLAEVNEVAPVWLKTVPKRLSALLNTSGLPAVLEPFSRTPVIPVASPDSALAQNPVVTATAPSVLKIRSLAPSCQKVLEGSGFVVAPDRVMTNAHVVAGSNSVQVYASGKPLDATVVSYDPSVDIALLAVPNLPPPPLTFAAQEAQTGTSVVVLGYPGGGNFTATPARIREAIKLSGPDIYRSPQPVTRDVYTIRANVEQGDSGGPLIDLSGQVLGVVFGAAVDDPETGFVLTAGEVADQLARIGATQRVGTGACVS
ncbi:acid resistance serine protease MarP [Mycobacterium simiae]|uniref:Acid resistance serine protease MarP n=1 Tax=Mycobacterium simiae TaxID=1784 RepID=A0A5B1BQR9_MYCSI|nr:acid resistance serine protease MarP [Mycobacterium simiae]KAA1251148.1 acid resistance serine protease MarP [Mycobacterium simiae]